MAAKRAPRSPEQKLARDILTRNLEVKKGENVTIEAWSHALPVASQFVREARRMGAHPLLLFDDEASYWDSVTEGEAKVLGKPGKPEWAALEKTDAYVFFWGPAERDRFDGVSDKTRERLTAFNEHWYKVARRAGLRGVRMELGRVCPSMARRWGVEEDSWRAGLVQASGVDPAELTRSAQRVAKRLHRARSVRITHPNGTDLTLELMGVKPRTTSGRPASAKHRGRYGMMASIPAGTVLTALNHKTGDGHFVANRPSFLERTRTEGADWRFRSGKLTAYSFSFGKENFEEGYSTASKGKERPGMISIGLNPASRGLPAVEDTEEGVVLVSVGGNSFAGGHNPSDGFNWAMLGGSSVELDGKPFLSAGKFVG